MRELWKDIKGYEGLYKVSNLGNIRSYRRGKHRVKPFLKSFKINPVGYKCVSLWVDSKPKHLVVHRLVAQAFVPNTHNKPEVNHISGIKTDNSAENLEWCTRQENVEHAFKTGLIPLGEDCHNSILTESDIYFIRAIKGLLLQQEIASIFNVDQARISRIHSKKIWGHI